MAKTRKAYFLIYRVMSWVDWYMDGVGGVLLLVVISFTDGNSTILRFYHMTCQYDASGLIKARGASVESRTAN